MLYFKKVGGLRLPRWNDHRAGRWDVAGASRCSGRQPHGRRLKGSWHGAAPGVWDWRLRGVGGGSSLWQLRHAQCGVATAGCCTAAVCCVAAMRAACIIMPGSLLPAIQPTGGREAAPQAAEQGPQPGGAGEAPFRVAGPPAVAAAAVPQAGVGHWCGALLDWRALCAAWPFNPIAPNGPVPYVGPTCCSAMLLCRSLPANCWCHAGECHRGSLRLSSARLPPLSLSIETLQSDPHAAAGALEAERSQLKAIVGKYNISDADLNGEAGWLEEA